MFGLPAGALSSLASDSPAQNRGGQVLRFKFEALSVRVEAELNLENSPVEKEEVAADSTREGSAAE